MSENNQTYKADSGKTRLDLVSPTFIEAVGKIRTFGVSKYGDSDSWAKVEPQRYMAALLRHINAYRMGEYTDKESGMPHLWHAACNLMFLIDLDELEAVSFGEGDTPPKENDKKVQHSCKDCEYCTYCDGLYSCSLYGEILTASSKCGDWQYKF